MALAGSQGHFQLNVYKPVMVHNVLESIQLLGDACAAFHDFCAVGLAPHRATIAAHLEQNLMLVTALNRHIGYDRAAAIAKGAEREGLSLRAAALAAGFVTEEEYDRWIEPLAMTRPG